MGGTNIAVNPIHLGLGAAAITEPAFTGSMDWYAGPRSSDTTQTVSKVDWSARLRSKIPGTCGKCIQTGPR